MTEKQAERKIRNILYKYSETGDYSVFIFGSRASDSAHKYSDFDIGILGDKPFPTPPFEDQIPDGRRAGRIKYSF